MRRSIGVLFVCLMIAAAGVAQQEEEPLPQARAAKAFAAKPKLPVPPKNTPLTPLSQRDRSLQLLDRFTFGAKPGQLEQVIAQGPDKWFEQQLNPDAIPDGAKDKRMGDFPTLTLSTE